MFERMMSAEALAGFSAIFIFLFVLAIIWITVLKFYALWRAGRNNQVVWFIFIAVLNTMGILPLIYLLAFQKKGKVVARARKK
jgi:predicted permease